MTKIKTLKKLQTCHPFRILLTSDQSITIRDCENYKKETSLKVYLFCDLPLFTNQIRVVSGHFFKIVEHGIGFGVTTPPSG
tara:strand:- start:572 stop:814 length:243 start_codon:yes stop_codon:yes gene_type:complete